MPFKLEKNLGSVEVGIQGTILASGVRMGRGLGECHYGHICP